MKRAIGSKALSTTSPQPVLCNSLRALPGGKRRKGNKMLTDILERCDALEECYEFMLAYAAQGFPSDETSPRVREFLRRAVSALHGLAESCSAFPDLLRGEKFVVVPVTLLMFAIGIAPQFIFSIFNTTVVQMARLLS